jgi:NADH-quinone oxidoreductase subunit N
MYFDEPTDATPLLPGGEARALLSFNALAVLGLGILPSGLLMLCNRVITQSLAG